ncbi:MAG: RICIN domain-containing protein, partial [Actinomycetes bacterium]
MHWEIRTDGGWVGFDGTIDPSWAYDHCGDSAPPAGANPVDDQDTCHSQLLRQGSGGGCVGHLQNHLNDYGYGLVVDNDFGPATDNAVRSFQSSRGLDADGVVGPATWDALHSGGDAPAPAPTAPAPAADRVAIGYIDSLNCNEISGWSFDPDRPDQSEQVHVYIDGPYGQGGTFAADVAANIYRPDVNAAYGISGSHGFNWSIPAKYKDGRRHTAYLYAIGLDANGNLSHDNPQITNYSFSSDGSFGPCQAPAAPAPVAAPPASNGGGAISTVQDAGLCLDVPGLSTAHGTRVTIWHCNGGANQKWTITATSGGYYRLTPTHATNMCLDVSGVSSADGA